MIRIHDMRRAALSCSHWQDIVSERQQNKMTTQQMNTTKTRKASFNIDMELRQIKSGSVDFVQATATHIIHIKDV